MDREIWLEMAVEPSGGPIRQKSAFLPEHPDNRISAHIRAYPRISGSIGGESQAAQSHLSCGIHTDAE
jgi:hypothetical protein